MPTARPKSTAHLFKPGQSGNPKGKPKGIKGRLSYNVGEICNGIGVNPFLILAQIARGELVKIDGSPEKTNAYLRKEAASELCQYLAPKLKAMDISLNEDSGVQIIINTTGIGNASNNNMLQGISADNLVIEAPLLPMLKEAIAEEESSDD